MRKATTQRFRPDIVRKRASEDVIQRQLILRKIRRMKAQWHPVTGEVAVNALDELATWVKGQATRARKPGGIGRQ